MTRIKLILVSLSVLALLAASGCGKEEAKSMTKEQVLEKIKAMMSSVVEAANANKDNCDGLADAMSKIVDDNKAVAMRAKELEKDAEAKKWLDEQSKKMMEELGPKLAGMMGSMMKCKDNEKLKKVNEKFEELMK
ncbi:MAG: hypothetical protein MJE77_36660 [Proteobacteria bacterium]|nr:hypothetical protein [Pseudomonadota bacterium]